MTLVPPKDWQDVRKFLVDCGYRSFLNHNLDNSRAEGLVKTIKSNPEQVAWLHAWKARADLDIPEDALPSVFVKASCHIIHNNIPQAEKLLQGHRKKSPNHIRRCDGDLEVDNDFTGIPSGLQNSAGRRSDSPLTDLDSDEGSPGKLEFTRKRRRSASSGMPSAVRPRMTKALTTHIGPESGGNESEVMGVACPQELPWNISRADKSNPSHIQMGTKGSELDKLYSKRGTTQPGPQTVLSQREMRAIKRANKKDEKYTSISRKKRSKKGDPNASMNPSLAEIAINQDETSQQRKSIPGPEETHNNVEIDMRAAKDKILGVEQIDEGAHADDAQTMNTLSQKRRASQFFAETNSSHSGSHEPGMGLSSKRLRMDQGPHSQEPYIFQNEFCGPKVHSPSPFEQTRPATPRILETSAPHRTALLMTPATDRTFDDTLESPYRAMAGDSQITRVGAPHNRRPSIYSDLTDWRETSVFTDTATTSATVFNETTASTLVDCSPAVRPSPYDGLPTSTPLDGSIESLEVSLSTDPPVRSATRRIERSESQSNAAHNLPSSVNHLLYPDDALEPGEIPEMVSVTIAVDTPESQMTRDDHLSATGLPRPNEQPTTIGPDEDIESSGMSLSMAPTHPVAPADFRRSPGRSEQTPPWTQSRELKTPPSTAKPPDESDTHSWPTTSKESPLLLPRFLQKPFNANVRMQVEKPPLPLRPPVWAQSRQELCETLPYFRSYQGGVYYRGNKAFGYLLDGHPAMQDVWHADGKLIISHGGGNSAVDKATKETVLIKDQTSADLSCAALIKSYNSDQPIFLIAGNGYNLFPYDLENRSYIVLGYYLISHAWEEPEPSPASPRGYFVRWKFLFQWIDGQGPPWWIEKQNAASHGPVPVEHTVPNNLEALRKVPCGACGMSSPRIYAFGWVCTNSACASFFRLADETCADQEGYFPSFLKLHEEPEKCKTSMLDVRPNPPVRPELLQGRETTSRQFWRGFWCEKCGKVSCREYWTHWECTNCHERFGMKHRIHAATEYAPSTASVKIQVGKHSGIQTNNIKRRIGDYLFQTRAFRLPWNRGTIYLIQGSSRANQAADDIFLQYQRDAEDPAFFRRYSMKTHKLKGRMLSHYFSQNSGEFYKYIGGTDNTVPFGKYPSVDQAVKLIRERTSFVLGEDPLFNEILSAAYMTEQKMDFHSDGENDLGPIVASLSLGSPALMRFRAIPSRVNRDTSESIGRKPSSIVLTLTLRHGDILVMAGAEIQEYYQHAVHPTGFRIAATARYIKKNTNSDHISKDGQGGQNFSNNEVDDAEGTVTRPH